MLLGRYDLVLIVDFPTLERAVRSSLELTQLSRIAFSTQPALSIKAFDRIIVK